MPMFKLKTAKIVLVFLISVCVLGCESVPRKDLVDIDNVLTEKQKKEVLTQAKAAEAAKFVATSAPTSNAPAPDAKPVA